MERRHEGDERLEEAVIDRRSMKYSFFPRAIRCWRTDEAEAVAEFEEEGLQARDEAVFEFALANGAAQAEELEVGGTLEHFIRLLGEVLGQGEVEVGRLLFGDGAFAGTGFDLIEQHIARPAKAGGGAEIPEAGDWIGELCEDVRVVSPRSGRHQFSHSL